MATYSITEDPNNKWVKLITINTNKDIDISNDIFNITVKDQLEYFIGSHIKEGSTFELEELFKKDTFPTLEISNNAVKYARQKCFTCAKQTDVDIESDNRMYVIKAVKDDILYYVQEYAYLGETYYIRTNANKLEEAYCYTKEHIDTVLAEAQAQLTDCTLSKLLYPTQITCPICGGTGIINVGPRSPSRGCTNCGGSGSTDHWDEFVKGTGKIICPDCEGEGHAHAECTEEWMWTEQYVSNVLDYCNSDYDSLVKNGIQFWVDGVNKRTLTIRVVTKGQSTKNPDGYIIWDPAQNKYVETGYVGFTVANFNITLNKNERLVFNCFLMPTVNMGDPEPYFEYTVPSAWSEEPHVLSGNIRTDYDWNDDYKGIDNLYVNNSDPKKSSAYYYEQDSDDEYRIYWHTDPPTEMESYPTPMYCVKSSAYVTDYLKTGSATDLYLSSGDDIVSACRDFYFNSSSVNSYLINEYTKKRIPLDYSFDGLDPIDDYVFLESNGYNIHDKLYCYEIVQKIVDSSCSGIIRDNQVKLDLEI